MTKSKELMSWGRASVAGLALLLGWLVAGCQSTPPDQGQFAEVEGLAPAAAAAQGQAPAATPAAQGGVNSLTNLTVAGSRDKLAPGESVEVVFSDLPPAMMVAPFKVRIKDDGTITLLQNQSFVAAGKTRGELEKEIRARYVPKFFLNLTVTIAQVDRFYYVGGEVKRPGRELYTGPITVVRAIQSCGDFTDFAKKTKVQLNRAGGKTIVIDVPKAIKNPELDLEVFPGDNIHVPRRIW